MLFSCTVGQLVNKLLATLAVSDQISLETLWIHAAGHANTNINATTNTNANTFDTLQKNVLWRALMMCPGGLPLEISVRNHVVAANAGLTYGALLLQGSEQEILLRPTEAFQFRYLGNTDDYAALKTSLGEFPFALLIVIARHGAAGILNADLARESGQDIRSLRLRLQKLEAAGLIVTRNIYINKKHTTQSIHVKFAEPDVLARDREEAEESLDVSRDRKKLMTLIIAALKQAPNRLRGFSDLKKEFKLDGSRSATKFFRGTCLRMHALGYIEKLQVEIPETKQRVYAVQFVKDLPLDLADAPAFADADVNEKDDAFGESDDDEDPNDAHLGPLPDTPVFNKVFPVLHQIFQKVHQSESRGITAAEVCKNLLGSSEYRPVARLFEQFPSYLSNSKDLKPAKRYAEPYDEYSISKLYENEGKLRFYKYFAMPFCTEKKPAPKPYKFVVKPSKLALLSLQTKLYIPASKISNSAIIGKKRRMIELEPSAPKPAPPAKKQKRKTSKKTKGEEDEEIVDIEDEENADLSNIDVALAAHDRSLRQHSESPRPSIEVKSEGLENIDTSLAENGRRRRRAAPKSFFVEDAMEVEQDSSDEYSPKPEEEEEDDDAHIEEEEDEGVDEDGNHKEKDLQLQTDDPMEEEPARHETPRSSFLSASDLPAFVPAPKQERRKTNKPVSAKPEGSLKSIIRRDHLLDIIREEGGATFKSASLCKKIDQRLEGSTSTDPKTLGRDIAYLTDTGILETKKVLIQVEEKQHEKRILVLKDPAQRPSQEAIDAMKARFAEQMSKKDMKIFSRRVIHSDIKLYVEKPNTRKVSVTTKSRRGRGRLATLEDGVFIEIPDESTLKSRSTKAQKAAIEAELDIFEKIKRAKRPRKAVQSSTPLYGPKRTRRSIKLEKSDSTILYRCIVISKAFFKEAIDFNKIALILGNIDGQVLRQKWATLRRLFGGGVAVNKSVETFQNMVLQGVENGEVTEQDLVEGDLKFFLKFWTKYDKNTDIVLNDDMPLYPTVEENTALYAFDKKTIDNASSLLERIEFSSMRQKEFALGEQVFSYEPSPVICPNPDDNVRSILKSIFTTGEGNFDPNMVKTVLSKFGDTAVRAATNALLHDKEIQYLAFENEAKFVLGDRFKNTLVQKLLSANIFHQAASFKETLSDISAVGKGLILSQGIHPGEVAALLELVSDDLVELTRIDRTFKFENYESRLVDKTQIGCDIVVQVDDKKARKIEPIPVAVPLKAPCEPIWVDLNAGINRELWTKIIVSILAQIVFRPGIKDYYVHEKMQAVLSYADYCDAMEWLIKSGCVRRTDAGGYMATNCWQYILGH